jgi:hypothetical protein
VTAQSGSLLATRRGKLLLLLLCAVQFLDVVNSSIMNVACHRSAITAGFHSALLVCAFFLLAAAVIGLRATNSRGEPLTQPSSAPPSASSFPRRN